MVGIDDAMDIFAEHGVGGMVGLLFTALCADSTITALDGVTTNTKGGWIDHNWQQLRIQAVYVGVAALYTLSVSAVLLKIINSIPLLRLRCTEEEESMGMDAVDVSCFTKVVQDKAERPYLQVGEFANDFVEFRRDYQDWAQSGYRRASRQSSYSKTFIIAPSYAGVQNNDEVNKRESIVNHSFAVNDIKHTDEQEEFARETETPSSYFELPRPPKNALARLATPQATKVKLPTSKLSNIRAFFQT
jgi:hypothetical protein